MEKHKLILISIFAGIGTAILLFVVFSLGAIVGSRLRFYGYKKHTNAKSDSVLSTKFGRSNLSNSPFYIAQIQSISNGKIKVLNINKKHISFNIAQAKVFSFSGTKESSKILKVNDYIFVRKIGKILVIRVL